MLCNRNHISYYKDARCTERSWLYHYEILIDQGIFVSMARFTFNGFTRFYLLLRINPKRILKNDDFISVSHEFETEAIYESVNVCLNSIGIYDKFERFALDRIDYCINCEFINENSAAYYMELLKRSAILTGFNLAWTYDKIQHRKVLNENAIYAYNKSIRINFYNKYPQMLNNPAKYRGNLDIYRGIIRFEVQCHKRKIRSMKYAYDLTDTGAFRWMREDLSEKTLLFYVNKIFYRGDYFTLPEARQIVSESNFQSRTKQVMVDLLELVNKKRNLEKALDILCKSGVRLDYLNQILDRFEVISVNPVTIPINWGISWFESPYRIVTRTMEINHQIVRTRQMFNFAKSSGEFLHCGYQKQCPLT